MVYNFLCSISLTMQMWKELINQLEKLQQNGLKEALSLKVKIYKTK